MTNLALLHLYIPKPSTQRVMMYFGHYQYKINSIPQDVIYGDISSFVTTLPDKLRTCWSSVFLVSGWLPASAHYNIILYDRS